MEDNRKVYKYPCKVIVNDENILNNELYPFLRAHNYYIDSPYQSCVGNGVMYPANVLVTCNDKRIFQYNFLTDGKDGYAILTREDVIKDRNFIDCGEDIELFKKLVIIKDEDENYDFGNEIINIKNACLIE